eukprot:2287632-Amphidinium_carterae.1
MEITPAHPSKLMLQQWLPAHRIHTFVLDPEKFGLPSHRSRRYTVAIAPWLLKHAMPRSVLKSQRLERAQRNPQDVKKGSAPPSDAASKQNVESGEGIVVIDSDGDETETFNVEDETTPSSLFGCSRCECLHGDFWYCAPQDYLSEYLEKHSASSFRGLLQAGDLARLEEYERAAAQNLSTVEVEQRAAGPAQKRQRQRSSCTTDVCRIWDLKQNCAYSRGGSKMLPCLLCRCTAL